MSNDQTNERCPLKKYAINVETQNISLTEQQPSAKKR
jgi:hypothetical protein